MLFPVFLKILLKSALYDLSARIITFAFFFLEPVQLKLLKLYFMIKFKGEDKPLCSWQF